MTTNDSDSRKTGEKELGEIDRLFSNAEKMRFNDTAYITVDDLKTSVKKVVLELNSKLDFVCGVCNEQKLEIETYKSALAEAREAIEYADRCAYVPRVPENDKFKRLCREALQSIDALMQSKDGR